MTACNTSSKTRKPRDVTQRLAFGMLITLVGGFMDAYSYTLRGHVFATGQTGNFVLLAVRLMEGDYRAMVQALCPIVSFWVGMFLVQHLLHRVCGEDSLPWRRNVLILDLGLLFLVGWIPATAPNILANTLISLTAALQYGCFRNLGEDAAYATIFCTGNMRSCAEHYYKGLVLRERESLHRAYRYTGILLAFFLGACLGAGLSVLGPRCIWLAGVPLLLALGTLLWSQRSAS